MAADKTVEVTVSAPFQVVLDGVAYAPGDKLSAPPSTAELWTSYGWVTPTK
jgi:hypothetical protein